MTVKHKYNKCDNYNYNNNYNNNNGVINPTGHNCISNFLEFEKTDKSLEEFKKMLEVSSIYYLNNCISVLIEYYKDSPTLINILNNNQFLEYILSKIFNNSNIHFNTLASIVNILIKTKSENIEDTIEKINNKLYLHKLGTSGLDELNKLILCKKKTYFEIILDYSISYNKSLYTSILYTICAFFNAIKFNFNRDYHYNANANANANAYKLVNDVFLNIENTIYNDKDFKPSHDIFIKCLVYSSYESALKLLTKPSIKLTNKSLQDFLDLYFINLKIFNSEKFITDTYKLDLILNIFFDNNDNNDNIKSLNITQILKLIKESSFYAIKIKKSFKNSRHEIIQHVINALIEYGLKLTIDNFRTLTFGRITINNLKKAGIDVNDEIVCTILAASEFNPYGIKMKLSLSVLQETCKTNSTLSVIKEFTKSIIPDTICLENACTIKNNYYIIEYLCTRFNIKPTLKAIMNALKANGGDDYTYIVNSYIEDNNIENEIDNKKENKKNNKKEKDISDTESLSSISSPTEVVKEVVTFSEDGKKKITKKIIKKVVKKSKDGTIKPAIQEDDAIFNFVFPINYDYKTEYKLKGLAKNITSSKKISHIDLRQIFLAYLAKNNILKQDIDFNNIKFNIKNIDKFIALYMVDY